MFIKVNIMRINTANITQYYPHKESEIVVEFVNGRTQICDFCDRKKRDIIKNKLDLLLTPVDIAEMEIGK